MWSLLFQGWYLLASNLLDHAFWLKFLQDLTDRILKLRRKFLLALCTTYKQRPWRKCFDEMLKNEKEFCGEWVVGKPWKFVDIIWHNFYFENWTKVLFKVFSNNRVSRPCPCLVASGIFPRCLVCCQGLTVWKFDTSFPTVLPLWCLLRLLRWDGYALRSWHIGNTFDTVPRGVLPQLLQRSWALTRDTCPNPGAGKAIWSTGRIDVILEKFHVKGHFGWLWIDCVIYQL